ncbi:restriction endonuclease subunit S [Enterococcus faecalis]|nr:restriction endonuclease subunit S [Enterococcus faecalis]EKR9293019.1 restriction endonuclease subunit S [Enterococcus faecalis]HCU0364506.1 restriction endonuclease subunit S [Enterococcus faecalis]
MKKVPRLRFRGFQEDWELCKVKDFLIESKIKGSNGKIAKKLTVKLWRKGIVAKEEVYEGSLATQYYVRKSGQFMYGKLDFLNQAFGIVPIELDGYESTVDSPSFDFKPLVDSVFFLEYVSLEKFYKYQGNIANGSRKAKRIHVETFFNMPLPTPSYKEQQKIGTLFKQLDDTITLHQRKLYQLKELKKAYLKAMFVSMNTKNNKVPKLRFTDFEGDWEHRKLDDSIKVMDGDRGANYPHDTDFFKDGDTLFLDTGNVTKNGFKFDSVKYITNEKDEQLRAGKLEKNDFVLTSRGTLGNVGFYDEVVYNLHPKIRINSAMLILRNTDEQLSYSYLHTLLKGQLISDFMKKNQVGSAQPHITKSEFLKLNLNVPCNINEQNKIGNFFKSLDVTITLHQNKLEQLKDLKTSYLQNMFI